MNQAQKSRIRIRYNTKATVRLSHGSLSKDGQMFLTILLNIGLQLFYFIGAIYLGGFLISLINRGFYRLFGNNRAVVYVTGFIGTPVHEISHALMCLIFAHKIEEIKFFQVGDEDGVLGYVKHSYNPKNVYARIGTYFIGIAPILMGCGILCLSMFLLAPDLFRSVGAIGTSLTDSGASFKETLGAVGAFFKNFGASFGRGEFWIFLLINLFIAMHMTMSGADIKNSLTALPFLIGFFLVINLFLGFVFPSAYLGYCGAMNNAGAWIIMILVMAMIFSLFYLLIGLLIKLIFGGIGRLFQKK